MADLLTDAERAEIRAVIRDVTDTFMKSPITYYKAGESVDIFQESKSDTPYSVYNLMGLLDYPMNVQDKMEEDVTGAWDYEYVDVTFNFEELQEKGLVSAEYAALMNPETDYFVCKGMLYKPEGIFYDGPLDAKAVLLVLKGRHVQPPANFPFVV